MFSCTYLYYVISYLGMACSPFARLRVPPQAGGAKATQSERLALPFAPGKSRECGSHPRQKNASFIHEKWSRMTISWPQIPEIDCKCSQWIVPAQRFTIQNESSHPAFLSNVLCPVMFFTTPPQLIASPPFQEPLCHPSARGPCHHLWAWPGASSAPCLAPLTCNLQRFNGKNGLSL